MTSYFSLTQAFNGFVLACQARRLSHHTIADYSNTLRKLTQYLDNKAVNEIIKYNLRCFLADQRVSNKTLLNDHTGLSSFFKWTKNEEIVDINPLAGIQRPKAEQRVIQPIPEEYIRAILSVIGRVNCKRNGAIITAELSHKDRHRALILLLLINLKICIYQTFR